VSDSGPSRPRQVTTVGWLLMVGSAFVLVLVFQRVAGLHSLETQAAVDRFVAEPPGSDLGISADTVITVMRTLAMVTGGCAAAAAILGYQVMQRSRSARLAVTVLAVPLFLAGFVTGGFLTSLVAVSAVVLWLQPARAWFDGTTPPEPRTASASSVVAPVTPPSAPSAPSAPPLSAPPATGVSPDQPGPWPTPYGTPYGTPYAAAPTPTVSTVSDRRPPTVLWACVLTWVCTSIVVAALLVSAAVLAVQPDPLLDEAHRQNPDLADQGVTDGMLIAMTYVMIAGVVAWCVSAAVLAVLVFRRVDWARIVLVISAATAGALCLIGSLVGAIVLALPLLASALCVGLLLRSDTRPWFQRRGTP
jgi:hypothetical protein